MDDTYVDPNCAVLVRTLESGQEYPFFSDATFVRVENRALQMQNGADAGVLYRLIGMRASASEAVDLVIWSAFHSERHRQLQPRGIARRCANGVPTEQQRIKRLINATHRRSNLVYSIVIP